MPKITLGQADRIIDAALARAEEIECQPLTVAVLDDGGHLVAFKRQDGSSIMRQQIAFGKAWGALGVGRSSRGLEQMAKDRPHFISAAVAASDGRMVPVAGGVLVVGGDGVVAGAVGISGDTSDRDEDCVKAGIAAVGLAVGPE
ncbi:MAG: GlcG/HbpS family heme-binding protein [Alphaproteobacteria bacterium]